MWGDTLRRSEGLLPVQILVSAGGSHGVLSPIECPQHRALMGVACRTPRGSPRRHQSGTTGMAPTQCPTCPMCRGATPALSSTGVMRSLHRPSVSSLCPLAMPASASSQVGLPPSVLMLTYVISLLAHGIPLLTHSIPSLPHNVPSLPHRTPPCPTASLLPHSIPPAPWHSLLPHNIHMLTHNAPCCPTAPTPDTPALPAPTPTPWLPPSTPTAPLLPLSTPPTAPRPAPRRSGDERVPPGQDVPAPLEPPGPLGTPGPPTSPPTPSHRSPWSFLQYPLGAMDWVSGAGGTVGGLGGGSWGIGLESPCGPDPTLPCRCLPGPHDPDWGGDGDHCGCKGSGTGQGHLQGVNA